MLNADVSLALVLTAEDPSSLYFDKFLRTGVRDCPDVAERFPAMTDWTGIAGLKSRIAALAGVANANVLLSSRSASLMRLAAWLLCRGCRHMLTTDLSWPGYQRILLQEAERTARRVTVVPIRRELYLSESI